MENLTSLLPSSRDSGSAFMSQYCRPGEDAPFMPGAGPASALALAVAGARFVLLLAADSCRGAVSTAVPAQEAGGESLTVPLACADGVFASAACSGTFLGFAELTGRGAGFDTGSEDGFVRVERRGGAAAPASTASAFLLGIFRGPSRSSREDRQMEMLLVRYTRALSLKYTLSVPSRGGLYCVGFI